MNEKTAPFQSMQTPSGKYRLCWTNPKIGETKTVSGIGLGICEFEIVHTMDTRPYVIVKRHGNMQGPSRARLFLVNYKKGTTVPEMPFGAHEILIDDKTQNIYFNALTSAGKETTTYSWCLPRGGIPIQTLNRPSRVAPTTTVITNQAAPICIIPLVVEIKPHAIKKTPGIKRKRGRPVGSTKQDKNIIVAPIGTAPATTIKKKRGRPLGSKNKPKPTPAPIKPKTNRKTYSANRKPVKRGLYGTYYDIYVNGNRIATQRLNAELKTFMNDKILSVQYTLPSTLLPVYDIILPNLALWNTDVKNKYSNTPAMPNALTDSTNGLKIKLSNGGNTMIDVTTLSKMPDAAFIIIPDIQKEH